MSATRLGEVRALLFDVFGTVVDWRQGIAREGRRFAARHGIESVDWLAFADAWRARYQPAMQAVRDGRREFVTLDVLHRENLDAVLEQFGVRGIPAPALEAFNRAWHRLDPWPDVRFGLARVHRRYVLAPMSNGNVALIVAMARRAALPWDTVLGAELARDFKPRPVVYQRGVELLGLAPAQCLMVAAHNDDLAAARALGLRTAFVLRASEHGAEQTSDLGPACDWDVVTDSFTGLADELGC